MARTRGTGTTVRRGAIAGVLVALVAAGAGCASSSNSASSSGATPRGNASAGTAPAAARPALGGWDCPNGVCQWDEPVDPGFGVLLAAGGGSRTPGSAAPGDVVTTTRPGAPATTTSGPPASSPVAVPPTSAGSPSADSAERLPADALPVTSGRIDDNASWNDYLLYRQRAAALGIDPAEPATIDRQVLTVTDGAGHPVLGADIDIRGADGSAIAKLATHADGRAVFRRPPAPATGDPTYQAFVSREGATAQGLLPPGRPEVTIPLAPVIPRGPVRLDVLLLVDATASMADELGRLQADIDSITTQIGSAPEHPDVHFALTLYRDRGPHELFLTRTFDFTADPGQFAAAVREARAAGGGDTPEDLAAGLHDALAKPAWRGDDTAKVVLLVSDAPPHLDDPADPSLAGSAADAAAMGVQIVPIAANGTDLLADYVFRDLAQATMGEVVYLTGDADGTRPVRTPHRVTPDEYSALPLDRLVVRLAMDASAAAAGG